MLKQYIKVDENGFYLEPVLFNDEDEIPECCVEPYGTNEIFYKPKWDGEKWVESLSQEEIDDLKNSQPQPQPQLTLEKLKEENELNAMAIMELTQLLLGGE